MFGNFLLTYSVYGKWTDFLYSVFLHYLNTLYNLPHSHKHIFLCVFLRKCFLSNVHTHLCSDGCIESNLGLCLTQRYHFPKQMICLADLAQVLCWLSYLMMKPYPFIWGPAPEVYWLVSPRGLLRVRQKLGEIIPFSSYINQKDFPI